MGETSLFWGIARPARRGAESDPAGNTKLGRDMADNDIDLFLSELDATFDATLDRAEAEAVSDLAHSLAQETSLARRLHSARCAFLIRTGKLPAPVTVIARDYVVIDWPDLVIVPLRSAILRVPKNASEPAGPRPRHSDALLVGTLRHLARKQPNASVNVDGDVYTGVIRRAAPDHIALDTSRGEVLVAIERIAEISFTLAGLADEL